MNGQLDFKEAPTFDIETIGEVAEALQLSTTTIRIYASGKNSWKGPMAKLCAKSGDSKISAELLYIFPKGTIAANKEQFTRRKKAPNNREMQCTIKKLQSEINALKSQQRLMSESDISEIKFALENGGLIPAEKERDA